MDLRQRFNEYRKIDSIEEKINEYIKGYSDVV